MTGTVWDPVITGTPMRLHKHVLRFWKIQNLHVVCDHPQRLLSVWLQRYFACTSLATWSTKENERQWEWPPLESMKQQNTLYLQQIEVLSCKIHSRQLPRGMHINKLWTTIMVGGRFGGGGSFFKSQKELTHKKRTTSLSGQQGDTINHTLSISQLYLQLVKMLVLGLIWREAKKKKPNQKNKTNTHKKKIPSSSMSSINTQSQLCANQKSLLLPSYTEWNKYCICCGG